MAKIFNKVISNIDEGMRGLNRGLPMGLDRTTTIINDVQRGRYDLVAAKTSVGKTAFVDQCYVTNPLEYVLGPEGQAQNIKYDCLYFSLEISAEDKLTKLLARKLYDETGIVTGSSVLLSRGQNELNPEIRQHLDTYADHFEKFEEYVHIMDEYTTSEAIHNKIMEFANENGTFTREKGRFVYTPHHPNHYVLLIVDTINLVEPMDRQTLKQAIDALSKKFIWFRNVCKYTPVVVQQYNAEISDPRRIQTGRVEPIGDDLEDSKRTSKDCNTYLSLFDPLDMGLSRHRGYDIKRMKGNFRQLQVIKNRDGERGSRVGLKFGGAVGLFEEIPRPKEMTDQDYNNVLQL